MLGNVRIWTDKEGVAIGSSFRGAWLDPPDDVGVRLLLRSR
jgi:hypothetical protein